MGSQGGLAWEPVLPTASSKAKLCDGPLCSLSARLDAQHTEQLILVDGKENSNIGIQITQMPLFAEWPWEGYLTHMNLRFLIYKLFQMEESSPSFFATAKSEKYPIALLSQSPFKTDPCAPQRERQKQQGRSTLPEGR